MADSCRRLGQRLGCVLWDDEEDAPFVRAIDPVRYPPVQQIVGAASPCALLRIFLAGLSEQISMAAAETALSVPTQIVGSIANADLYDVAQLAHTLSECQPEAMVVVGGYDSAPTSSAAAHAQPLPQSGAGIGSAAAELAPLYRLCWQPVDCRDGCQLSAACQ